MLNIEINSNLKEIEITRNGKSAGSIYFDPSDAAILTRLKNLREYANGLYKEITEYKSEDVEDSLAKVEDIDKRLRAALDTAFDYPCSDVVFGNSYFFTSKNGVSMLEQFIEGAMKIIADEIGREGAEAEARQAKYLDKYRK